MRKWLGPLLVALGSLVPSVSLANGRFPESLRVVEDPRSPDRLFLSATYGLLVTEDRGKNWWYICEKAFAFEFIEGDPTLEVMPDGTILSGIYESLNASNDCGCSWRYVLGEPANEAVYDITLDGSASHTAVALLTDIGTALRKSSLHETTDDGKTWHKLSEFPSDIIDAYTVDIAPTDPKRLYVSALSRVDGSVDRGVMLVSKDRGMTWEEFVIPQSTAAAQPYIAAVHPTNPDQLFVRTDEWVDNVDPSANDALLYSDDGGKTWKELLRKGAKMLGFALSPDGNTVLVGLGDPLQAGGRSTTVDDMGVYKASTKDLMFEKIYSGMVSCLRWTSHGLYVCNTQFNGDLPPYDFELGVAQNADFTLSTPNPLTTLLDLKNVRGPLGCTGEACRLSWTLGTLGNTPVCQQFQATCDVPASTAGLSCGTDGGPSGGSGGGPDGGGAGSGAGGATGGDAGSGGSGGCGCRVLGVGSGSSGAAGALLALLAVFGRYRRSARRR